MPFFSIIIPTYNCETTIARAVDSVLSQQFEDFEILIMDGLSTDGTIENLKHYDDKRLKIFSEKDKGVYDAMNKGIIKASGSWLYFLGSDDFLHNHKVLQTIHSQLSKYTEAVDVLYGNISSDRYGTKYDGEFNKHKILKKNIGHQAIFYNAGIFKNLGMYNLKYKLLADYDFNLRWMLNKKISHKYLDIIVADYSTGGLSDTFEDNIFYGDFNYIILKYRYKWMPSIILKYYCMIKEKAVKYIKKNNL